ncbi:MAG: thiamine phosphate synthase [Tannerella sp.]|jgi:thiamine-phosphate pyrophosphorylase|nr:thiamine phosphate synthase [Tannerella sp.]
MKLIAITTEALFDGEPEALNMLFDDGLESLHLRKPSASKDETECLIRRIDERFRNRIVVHDHYSLAGQYGLKGIHLNKRNELFTVHCSLFTAISRSCHTLDEVSACRDLEYVFLSPIFDSISKAGYRKRFERELLVGAGREGTIDAKVIALGGITKERIPEVRSYGFGGVAVIGALWNAFPKDGDLNGLSVRFKELRNKCGDYCL